MQKNLKTPQTMMGMYQPETISYPDFTEVSYAFKASQSPNQFLQDDIKKNEKITQRAKSISMLKFTE